MNHRGPGQTDDSEVSQDRRSFVGYLYEDVPHYVTTPPIEAVTFGWGVNEDGQLVGLVPASCCYRHPVFAGLLCSHGSQTSGLPLRDWTVRKRPPQRWSKLFWALGCRGAVSCAHHW